MTGHGWLRGAVNAAALAGALLSGCNDEADTGIDDLEDAPSYAVQRSDYESAAVALLDGRGALLDESYLSSGTRAPGLNAPLHGDIVLPTTPCRADVLVVVARLGGDYVLEVDLETNQVMRQVATQASDPEDEAAYRANPQDVLCLGDDLALVARFEPNLAAEDGDLDQGDDLAVLDMGSERIVSRIDLSQVRVTVESEDDAGQPVQALAYARPGSIVRVGGHAVVGLGRLSASWVAAPGAVALIDLETRELAQVYELEGLSNCPSVAPVAGRDDAVIVQCSGYPFGDAASAGVAMLRVTAEGELEQEHALREQDAPAIFGGAVSLGGTRMVGVATGDFTADTGDEAFVVDLESGERQALLSAGAPGDLGSGVFDAERGLLLIPDAAYGVRAFTVDGAEIVEAEGVPLDPALPARTIRALRP